jgi:DNA-binding response OmpR family regulator
MDSGSFRVLCVDDDADCRELIKMWLRLAPGSYELTSCANAAEALHILKRTRFDVMILDDWLPDSSGIDLCREIRKTNRATPILFFSASAFRSTINEAFEAGANTYITKPADGDEFVGVVENLLKSYQAVAA